MASAPATHLILFIASLVLAVAIAGTVVMEVNSMSDVIDNRGSSVSEEIGTEIEIINDEGTSEGTYNDGSILTLFVKNTGSESLSVDERSVDVLVDGSYIPNGDIDSVERVDADSNSWRPGGVVEVEIHLDGIDVEGDTDITVITSGSEDTIRIHVPEE